MKRVDPSPSAARTESDDSHPGVPFFHTWKAVYTFVVITFVAVVLALAAFSHLFA